MIIAAILPLIFMAVELAYTQKFNGIVPFFFGNKVFIWREIRREIADWMYSKSVYGSRGNPGTDYQEIREWYSYQLASLLIDFVRNDPPYLQPCLLSWNGRNMSKGQMSRLEWGGGNKIGYFILAKTNIRCRREVFSKVGFPWTSKLLYGELSMLSSCGLREYTSEFRSELQKLKEGFVFKLFREKSESLSML